MCKFLHSTMQQHIHDIVYTSWRRESLLDIAFSPLFVSGDEHITLGITWIQCCVYIPFFSLVIMSALFCGFTANK